MSTTPWRRSAPAWRRHLTEAAPDTLAALAEALDRFWASDVTDSERAAAFACSWRSPAGCGAVVERWGIDGTCERLAALGFHHGGPYSPDDLKNPDNYVVPAGRLKLFTVFPLWPAPLPRGEALRLYRGVAGQDDVGLWDGLSWTPQIESAYRYASRAAADTGRPPRVWTAMVPVSALLLHLGDPAFRKGHCDEYVVDTRVDFEATRVPIYRPVNPRVSTPTRTLGS